MAPQRVTRAVRHCGRGYVALSALAAGLATLTSPSLAFGKPFQGLDLVDDLTQETIQSMRTIMSVDFVEEALLEATVSVTQGGGALDEALPPGGCASPGEEGCSWPTYSMRDMYGVLHTCTVREETPGKAGGSKAKVTSETISKALEELDGRCATLRHEYWSYKWCHREEIIQFHDDADGKRTKVGLGKHTRTEVKRANSNVANTDSTGGSVGTSGGEASSGGTTASRAGKKSSKAKADAKSVEGLDLSLGAREEDGNWFARMLKLKKKGKGETSKVKKSDPFKGIKSFSEVAAVFDFYEGGAACKENGGHRHTRTSITCCATPLMEADGVSNTPLAILVSIQEVSVCSYLVQVCSRLLCPALAEGVQEEVVHHQRVPDLGKKSPDAAGARTTAGGVLDVLKELDACFPVKRESWWTYKLCFSTGIGQYREEIYQKPSGEYNAVISMEFSLGRFDRSAVDGMEKNLVRRGEGDGHGAIVLEFTKGTECDLTGTLRSSTVYLECGNIEEVKEVVEDSTCHYRVVASSPLLCSHPALMPKVTPVRTVECVAEDSENGKTGRK